VTKKKDMLGYDPLAWLKEEAAEAEIMPVEEEPTTSEEAQVATDEMPIEESVTTDPASQEEMTPEDMSVEAASSKVSAGDNHIDLGDAPHISEISDFYSSFTLALEKGGPISIDASRIENIDGPSLQLLCSFAHEAQAKGVELNWGKIAEHLRNSAQLLGIEENIWS
jgi:ABC-type transporter Mla MlaB component